MKNLYTIIYAIVHSATFHADDVFAAAFLRLVRPDLPIFRTCKFTDEQIADVNGDRAIAVDIGAAFGITEYDHHQVDKAYRPVEDSTYIDKQGVEHPIPYCGFGLLWRDYGSILCPMKKAWERVDKNLVLLVDKQDNGIEQNALSSAIAVFNPRWDDVQNQKEEDAAFWRAEAVAEAILKESITSANSESAAVTLVKNSKVVDGNILVLEEFLPWQDTVIEEMPNILFVVFPHKRGGYAVQTVPNCKGSFIGRKLFPERWLGDPDASLGMTFCHPGNFLAAVDTLNHAINVARIAIAE